MTPDRGSQMETQGLVEMAHYLDINSAQRMNGRRIFGELADALEAQSAQIATLQAEVERLREERKAADHRLVDRYRNPTTGMFSFPDDVAAIILALDKAETDRNAAIARAEAAEAVSLNEETDGPYTCRSCCSATWNDSDVCDQCEDEAAEARKGEADE